MALTKLENKDTLKVTQKFVRLRANGTFALTHTWPIKYNDSFVKSSTLCTTEARQGLGDDFDPQAACEFGQAMKLLFGEDALERAPIIYAQRNNHSPHLALVGLPGDVRRFLSATRSSSTSSRSRASARTAWWRPTARRRQGRLEDVQLPAGRQLLYVKAGWR